MRVGEEMSAIHGFNSGVPQGSVLSPILFSVFTADLPTLITAFATCQMYADDLKVYKVMNSTTDREALQLAVDSVVAWSSSHGLSLAINKTAVLSFGIGLTDSVYKIGDVELNRVSEIRDLGFIVTENLSFSRH